MKRTPWYPASIKPARDGVYETQFPRERIIRRVRDGDCWYALDRRISLFGLPPNDGEQWRGLAEKPEGK